MATPYDFMTNRNAQGNTYATGAQAQSNPYAMPNRGTQVGGQSANNPAMLSPATNPYGNSNSQATTRPANAPISLYGNQQNQPANQGGNIGGTYATGGSLQPGQQGGATAQYNPNQASQGGGYDAQMQERMQQYMKAQAAQQGGTRQAAQGATGYNTGQQPQQSNPYGVDTAMGGGAQPYRTGGIRGLAPAMQAGTGVGTRSLSTYGQQGGAPSQGGSAQPAQNQQQHGASTQPGQSQQQQYNQPQGSGQNTPNPDPYGQPWVDYMNADGSPHINYQYGQNGGGGRAPGPTGPNGGSSDYWGSQGQQPGRPAPYSTQYPQNDRGPNPNLFPPMSTGQQGAQPQGSAPNGSTGLPFTWDQYNQARNDNPRIAQEWAQMNLPYAQLGQNAYQYNQDFGESVRRDDRNYGLTADGQRFDQTMQTRQQYMAELQRETGIDQFDRTFAHQRDNDLFNRDRSSQQFTREGVWGDRQFEREGSQFDRNFALQQTGQNQQYGLDKDRFGLAQTQANWGQQNAQQSLYYQGQDQSLRELDSSRNYGLAQNDQGMRRTENDRNYGLSQNAQGMQAQQMAHSMGIDTRGMNLQELNQATQAAFQQQQLGQTATLSREQMASQERQATMAATGRQQAPSAKWVRSW